MSTRASIAYSNEPGKDYHLYQEYNTDRINVEVIRSGVVVTIEIMPVDEWRALGLPMTLITRDAK